MSRPMVWRWQQRFAEEGPNLAVALAAGFPSTPAYVEFTTKMYTTTGFTPAPHRATCARRSANQENAPDTGDLVAARSYLPPLPALGLLRTSQVNPHEVQDWCRNPRTRARVVTSPRTCSTSVPRHVRCRAAWTPSTAIARCPWRRTHRRPRRQLAQGIRTTDRMSARRPRIEVITRGKRRRW